MLLVDRKREFADEQVAKALVANALYEGRYPLVSALSRPVIAEAVAEVALELDAEAVVHGCTGRATTSCASSSRSRRSTRACT